MKILQALAFTTLFSTGQPYAGELQGTLPMPETASYVAECGSCHTAYAPTFLPAASWRDLMANLANHFGDDASLAPELRDDLLKQLERLAGDSPRAVASITRYATRPTTGEAALRITQGGFFAFMHDEVPGSFWKRAKIGSKANCGACHPNADQGSYLEREVRIPK